METKCSKSANVAALNLNHTATVTCSKQINLSEDLQNIQPSTSRGHSSMSLIRDDFANTQHDFAEVLDDETTTSGELETFDISSSNSFPISEPPVEVAGDESSFTDIIKLVDISGSESRTPTNKLFNVTEVYIINDDDDEGHNEERQSQSTATVNHIASETSGVIVTTGGAPIYLETPVIEEPEHHPQIIHHVGQSEFSDKTGKPKRLSDKFILSAEEEALVDVDEDNLPSNIKNGVKVDSIDFPTALVNESPTTVNKLSTCPNVNGESQHDKMSFRLKKMNINNTTVFDSSAVGSALNDRPSSSNVTMTTNMSEIESMDLIERRDFETEQRITGGIILKSNSLTCKNRLNLSLGKPCRQEQQATTDDYPSISNCNGRAVSSDSKLAYKDSTATPTSSRSYNSRLTKSTTKLNLCYTLSDTQQEKLQLQPVQRTRVGTTSFAKTQLSKPNALPTSTASSSVIVETPSTSANATNANAGVAVGELFSNSNSNDSLTGAMNSSSSATKTVASARVINVEYEQQPQQKQLLNSNSEVDHDSGCSRTSVLHPPAETENDAAGYEDAQPSTSSARCQYAPLPKSNRHVNASAQTSGRYLMRGASSTSFAAAISSSSAAVSNAAISSSSSSTGVNLSTTSNRNRRRIDATSHLTRNSTSEEVIAAFKVVVAEAEAAAAAAERGELNDSWADCEESHSDLEEICTCHHSSTESSHGGSNTSLNESEDLDHLGTGLITCTKDGDLSNYIQMVTISEETTTSDCPAAPHLGGVQQRKRKYNEGRLLDCDYVASIHSSGGGACIGDANSRKRIAYDYASTPRSSHSSVALVFASTPSSQLALTANSSPIGRRTPRSIIPTRDNPPPELQNWLLQFQRWSHVERLLAIDRLIEYCEPTQVRHMMKVIEPQFQRDFISLLPRELALQVLAYLQPTDLLRAAQTCRSWRFLCDDNLLWKEKCRKAQILTEPRNDRPKRGRAGNMPPIASPWKAAYMRQHIIEMNWRSRPIRDPKVLKGHDDHVITCLQFSGNRIVSGSDDNTLKVWSAVTGRCLRTLVGHTGGVWSSQMAGNIIISGSTDRTLKVWDMETGQCVHTLLGHTSTVRCMHLHGNKVVSGSRDATLRVWDIELGTCMHVLVGHLAAVRCVQYDGKLIVSGAYDYMVKIWHPERQECLHTLQGHTNRVYSLQFDGVHVVSGSLDTSIRVWDVETGNCKHTLMGHQSLTSGMELRQNILVSGNADSTVKVWDITTGQCLQTLSGPNKHQSAVTCLQFNSRFVVTSSDDGTVKLWDVKTGEFIRNLVALDSGGSGGVVWRIRANDTKLICAVGSRNGTEETKLMVLDFDVEGACVKCS